MSLCAATALGGATAQGHRIAIRSTVSPKEDSPSSHIGLPNWMKIISGWLGVGDDMRGNV